MSPAENETVIPGLIDMSIQPLRLADERLGRKFLAGEIHVDHDADDFFDGSFFHVFLALSRWEP